MCKADIAAEETFEFSENPAYVYYCDNETVNGVEFPSVPTVPRASQRSEGWSRVAVCMCVCVCVWPLALCLCLSVSLCLSVCLSLSPSPSLYLPLVFQSSAPVWIMPCIVRVRACAAGVELVCDMSSNFLTRAVDVSKVRNITPTCDKGEIKGGKREQKREPHTNVHSPSDCVPLLCFTRCLQFGLIYAGAQKNAGPAGLTVVIGA